MTAKTNPETLANLRDAYSDGLPFPLEASMLSFLSTNDYDATDYLLHPLVHGDEKPCAWSVCYRGEDRARCYAYVKANGELALTANLFTLVRTLVETRGLAVGPAEKVAFATDGSTARVERAIKNATDRATRLTKEPINKDLGPHCVLVLVSTCGEVSHTLAPLKWRSDESIAGLEDSLVWEARPDTSGVTPGGVIFDDLEAIPDRVRAAICVSFDSEYAAFTKTTGIRL